MPIQTIPHAERHGDHGLDDDHAIEPEVIPAVQDEGLGQQADACRHVDQVNFSGDDV